MSLRTPIPSLSFPEHLPINAQRDTLIAALREHQVVVIAGETGSGKTTQLPKLCLAAGLGTRGQIGCTQPRRIAALSVSRRIAEELSLRWGEEVGCKIRFSDHTKRSTVIKVMTDGILLAETRSDPLLSAYEVLIIDEAHERSLNIDFLIGYLTTLTQKRPELKVVITSATIDTALFSRAFRDAPIFEVSGRLFPVEVRYSPPLSDDEDEISYIDAALRAVDEVGAQSREGDILIFMPTERDIRETTERLSGRLGRAAEILPLMGSLSAAEQERVFKPTPSRKIIVATNIAETSITIPNIRYVIDTGLARISRYHARQRTQRLPIERISQSSAQQRTGRAGRVRDGVCIRLYNQDDFESRPEYTDPEILRANLAEVILRMKAYDLGDIKSFPFLNPPEPRAISGGYALLHELGAIDDREQITPLGKELARLPVDPTIARMLVQARRERVLPEVLVIAAGLSIQDPRERPLELREKADAIHGTFAHPDSDLLTLLNLWSAHAEQSRQSKGRSAARAFCKAHLLSFMRMREWNEIVSELAHALDESVPTELSSTTIKLFDGTYRAIHRAVLSGLLGQVAYRTERNTYRTGGDRELALFPTSSLAEKHDRREARPQRGRSARRDPAREQWIVSAEIVETSRVFARTAARIQPQWIEELGKHICKRAIENPHWSPHAQKAVAHERVSLHGLVIAYRQIDYLRVNPLDARDIVVRNLLMEDGEIEDLPFIRANRIVFDNTLSRCARKGGVSRVEFEERLVAFYSSRLPPLGSFTELRRAVKELLLRDPHALTLTPDGLLGDESLTNDEELYPSTLEIGGSTLPLHYRYAPGDARDGVTLALPLALARRIPARMVDGIIPGFREQQLTYLLRALPKQHRQRIDSIPDTARVIAREVAASGKPLLEALTDHLTSQLGLEAPRDLIALDALPDHLRPRIEVCDERGVISSGRDLAAIQEQLADDSHEGDTSGSSSAAWHTARASWERAAVEGWDFGDLPESIEVTRLAGAPVLLYPALCVEDSRVALRLLEERDAALRASHLGFNRLLENSLAREVRELTAQARGADALKPLITLFCTIEELRGGVLRAALAHMFDREIAYPLRHADFESAIAGARQRIPNLVPSIITWAKAALELRCTILALKKPYPGMREDLEALLPPNFLEVTPFEQLRHLGRYLKGMIVRAERADNDPKRDIQRTQQLAPYLALLRPPPPTKTSRTPQPRKLPPTFRWMVEEFKVSLFAQELGTAYPISAKRLDAALAEE